ncbi:MAG TPA: TRAP transporter small permease [Burkholderiales bacterium]|nr:TRAP transporter small permease [Burkholderiales bacterium]
MASACGAAAGVFLLAMMLLTVADVALRAATNQPIRGTFEIIELLLACTFFLALPAVFLREENLVVDVIDPIAPRWVPRLRRLAELLAVPVLGAMAWEGWKAAAETLVFNDVTSDLAIHRLLYWIPVLFGLIGAAAAAVAMTFRNNAE